MNKQNVLYFGSTDTGRVRDNNEDAFIAESTEDNRNIIACVIDGVGGYEGGEVAAQIARDTIRDYFRSAPSDPVQRMKEAFILANEQIYQERMNSSKNSQMACVLTLVIVDPDNNQFYYAHVGDTRLYLLRDHSLVKVTRDHSFVGFLEDSKRLSESEAMRHPKRNEINKALGFDPQIEFISDYIETSVSPFLPGDMLLLCSDGLSDMLDSQTISSTLTSEQPLEQKAAALIDLANKAGGKDNITVVLVQNTKQPANLEATRPAISPMTVKKNDKTEVIVPVKEREPEIQRQKKSSRLLIWGLSILCLLLFASLIWERRKNKPVVNTAPPVAVAEMPEKNLALQQLQDSLQQNPLFTIKDSVFGKTIRIDNTIKISGDSVQIKGSGIVWQSDSNFHGPAVFIPSSVKYLLLENIVFSNFHQAILTENKAIHLKNVRFVHCAVPVVYHYVFPDSSYINGTIGSTSKFTTDSLPKQK
jgi:serine/threonine protein phosphatase PrpC